MTKKKNKRIKIKKPVKGLMTTDTGFIEHEFWVQLTKDEDGMTLSVDDYTIPLEPLEIEVVELCQLTPRKVIEYTQEVSGRKFFVSQCPVCGCRLDGNQVQKYCHECGQSLKWKNKLIRGSND